LLICSLIPPFYQTCSAGHSYPGAELRGILSIKLCWELFLSVPKK